MPKLHKRYRPYLNMDNFNYPHRLAIVVIEILELMYSMNPKYNFNSLAWKLRKLCEISGIKNQDNLAKSMGFKDYNSINELVKLSKKRKIITFYPNKGHIYK